MTITSIIIVIAIVSSSAHSQCVCVGQGDLDGSGSIDVADLTYSVAFYFGGGPAPVSDADCPTPNRGDLNCDNTLDISDLTALVAYMFLGGGAPCDPCTDLDAPPGDPADLVWMQWMADNLNAAIYETGPSAFVYTNGFGLTVTDSTTGTDSTGDTTITIVRRMHFSDTAFVLQVVPFSTENSDNESDPGDEPAAETTDGRSGPRSSVTFEPSYCSKDGSQVTCPPLLVVGDLVTIWGNSVDFADPEPVGPPTISDQIINSLNNPPNMLTDNQIAQSCGEGVYSTSSCHFRSYQKSVTTSTSGPEGIWTYLRNYSFTFSHCWIFVCPDGPQKRELFLTYEFELRAILNGVDVNVTSGQVLYSYTYP